MLVACSPGRPKAAGPLPPPWAPELHLVHLEVRRGGPILPAAQGVHGDGAAERAGALAVQPQAEALLTEHVLRGQG